MISTTSSESPSNSLFSFRKIFGAENNALLAIDSFAGGSEKLMYVSLDILHIIISFLGAFRRILFLLCVGAQYNGLSGRATFSGGSEQLMLVSQDPTSSLVYATLFSVSWRSSCFAFCFSLLCVGAQDNARSWRATFAGGSEQLMLVLQESVALSVFRA